jgi:glutathione synthase/RimK-type ligase-like ATP-grasp enzyme
MTNYILENRAVIAGIKRACEKYGIRYSAFSDEWIIRLTLGDARQFVLGYNFDCNGQASAAIARDKAATHDLLKENGVASMRHELLSTPDSPLPNKRLVDEMIKRHESIVIKPVLGSRGENVARFWSADDAMRYMESSNIPSWAIAPYEAIVSETRLIVLDGVVSIAYEKTNPREIEGLKMYNLHLGADAKKLSISDLDADMVAIARAAMDAIGLRLGAVDIIKTAEGAMSVIEINSGFSLEHYAKQSAEYREEVELFYENLTCRLFNF